MFAVDQRYTATVAGQIERLGGSVEVRLDDIGYIRASVSQQSIGELAVLPGVIATEHYKKFTVATSSCPAMGLEPGITDKRPVLRLDSDGLDDAFVPLEDMGVRSFQKVHPRADGRGVSIAVLEGCNNQIADFANPSLRTAMTESGAPVRKIRAILDPAASFPPDGQLFYRLSAPLRSTSSGDLLQLDGEMYTLPDAGPWHLAKYKAGAQEYAVAWNTRGQVWIDTDENRTFKDNTPISDFNMTSTVGFFDRRGAQIPYAAVFDAVGNVLIYEGSNSHHTMTAGSAAADDLRGKIHLSAAPAAQVVLVTPGSFSRASILEAYILAARSPGVNIITESWGGAGFRQLESIILDRLVDRYGVVIFHAAENSGPWMHSEVESHTSWTLSVGAYFSSATAQAYFGLTSPSRDNLWIASSRGPSADGRIAPDIVAPLWGLAPAACAANDDRTDALIKYSFPKCYTLSGGTSSAAPRAAGALAALISALRLSHREPVNVQRLLSVVRDSARVLPGYQSYEQGYGLLDINIAWEVLQRASSPPRIDLAIRTPDGADQPGLYEPTGWRTRGRSNRVLEVTRKSGPPGLVRFALKWRENDGTFLGPSVISLPLNESVRFAVRIEPRRSGAHSGVLEVVDERTGLTVSAIGLTIIAARTGRHISQHGLSVEWPLGHSEFFDVPRGSQQLRISFVPKSAPVGLALVPKHGLPFDTTLQLLKSVVPTAPGKTGHIFVNDPPPGTWELRFFMCGAASMTFGDCTPYRDSIQSQHNASVSYSLDLVGAHNQDDVATKQRRRRRIVDPMAKS